MTLMIGSSHRRVRPRFFVFLACVVGLGVLVFMVAFGSSPTHKPISLLGKKTAASLIFHIHSNTLPFSLPQSLSDLQALTVDNSLIVVGITHQYGSGLSVSITPQGLVQGPSPVIFSGGNLIWVQNMAWWSGGMKGHTIQKSALNLESNRTYTNFLPTPLNRAAAALSPSGSDLFVLGGASQNTLSDRIYQMTEASGSFHSWGLLPVAVENPTAAVGGNFLIVAGGTLAGGEFNSDIWIYGLLSHHLLTTLHLPYGIQGSRLVYSHRHFWLLGGEKSSGQLLSSIWLVTQKGVIKTPLHLPVASAHFGVGVLSHRIWIVGGITHNGPTHTIRSLTLSVGKMPPHTKRG